MNLHSLPKIPGYQLLAEIGSGSMSVVYQAEHGGGRCALKLMREATADKAADAALRFRREAAAVARLNHSALVKVQEVGEVDGQLYLAMELVEGDNLYDLLEPGPLNEQTLLVVARTLAAALGEVHRHGLVHRDIKPQNVMLSRAGDVKLIDFGFVTAAESETGAGAGNLVGTLLYCAPEQIGVLKRPVDNRSDLYALGATLFHCATGRPPFVARSVPELIHHHAAVAPPAALELNPALRPVLSQIFAKLLAKDPDDRYQTAEGLLADLDGLGELEAAQRAGRPLVLGARDSGVRFAGEVALVGRDAEQEALRAAWARARAGHGAVLQLEGEGGSGKTRLVRELIRWAQQEGALVLGGKAQQSETVPLGPVREALDELATAVTRPQPPGGRDELALLREAAQETAGVMSRLSRGLARALNPDDPGKGAADADAEKERFYGRIADFFERYATVRGPLLLLIDDVQWLDDGSVQLLRQLGARLSQLPLLVVTTARNDPASEAAKDRLVEALGPALETRLVLQPLPVVAIGQLVAAHLGGLQVEAAFVERLAAISNGNPFAIGEYIRLLLDKGLLQPHRDRWTVDVQALSEVNLPKDLIQLVVNRLAGLGPAALEVLRVAGVVGLSFELSLVARALGQPPEAVARALHEAERANLIERTEATRFAFVHDRILEAVLRGVPPERLPQIHEAVAAQLEQHDDGSAVRLYALARHYAGCGPGRHPERLFRASLAAGLHALESHSNEEAFGLLERADGALGQLPAEPPEAAALAEAFGLACTRTARFAQASAQFDRALQRAGTVEGRARIHYLMGRVQVSQGDDRGAWVQMQKAYALLGESLPRSTAAQVLGLMLNWVALVFLGVTGLGYGRARGRAREKRRLVSQISDVSSVIAYMLSQPLLFLQLAIREAMNSHFLGTSSEHARARAMYGSVFGLLGSRKGVERNAQRGIAIAEQVGDRAIAALCRFYYALSLEYCGATLDAEKAIHQCIPEVRKYLGAWELSLALGDLGFQYLTRGYAREAVERCLAALPTVESTHNDTIRSDIRGLLYSQLTVLGRMPEALRWRKEQLEYSAKVPDAVFCQIATHGTGIHALLEQGELSEQLESSVTAFLALNSLDYHTRYAYLAIGYARYEQLRRTPPGPERRARERALSKELFRLSILAPTPVLKCHLLVLKAGLAREKGQLKAASKHLAAAARLANDSDSPWGRFGIGRERARLAQARDDAASAKQEALDCLELANKHGWLLRARQIRAEFQVSLPGVGSSSGSIAGSTSTLAPSSSISGAHQRHMSALLQVSQASASSLNLEDQARAVLDELVKVLGAERAFLFLEEGEELKMKAGRDAAQSDLRELKGYSSTVVAKARADKRPLVVAGSEEGALLGSESAVAHDLRSIMAAPLLLKDRCLGVVYLDNRLARGVFTEDDTEILLAIASHLAIAVEMGRAARIESERKALERDLALTTAVQSLLLPRGPELSHGPLALAAYYQPAAQCGGDWWWCETAPDGRVFLFAGDVTGHGAASAMVTTSVASTFQALLFLQEGKGLAELGMRKVVEALHANLERFTNGSYQMTFSALELDPSRGVIRWLSAGAPPVLLDVQGKAESLSVSGGAMGGDSFELGELEIPFTPGARLLLFTDGAFEIDLPNGRQLGVNGLRRALLEQRAVPLQAARDQLAQKLKALHQGNAPSDDITFILVEHRA